MKKKFGRPLIFHYIFRIRMLILEVLSTFYCRILLNLKGVHLGKHSKFFGVPFIYIYPGSQITIGNNNLIKSSYISNLIGIHRRTIIATHGDNAEIIIGNNNGFSGVVIGAKQSINIGNNVLVGANSLITDFDWHAIDPNLRHTGDPIAKPVIIHDNVFIGYSAVILKGVSIGENSIIGANSVVTIDIPSNVIAAGNPCKVISNLNFVDNKIKQ